MEMRNFRPESHVAQQSRRDKLRIQQIPGLHLEDYTNNLEQLSVHQGLNLDLMQLRNFKHGNTSLSYDPSVFSSEMIHFAANSPVLLAQKDPIMVHQDIATAQPDKHIATENASFANLSQPISSNFNSSAKVSGDPHNCSNWKSIGSQQNCDWIVNYSSVSTGIESSQNPLFVGEGLSGSLKVNNISPSTLYLKPSHYNYQDVQSSLANPSGEMSSQNSQKHFGDMHFISSPLYHNTLQEVVTSGTTGTQGLEMASLVQQNVRETSHGSWADGGNELLLLPSFVDQSNALRLNNASGFITRSIEGCHQSGGARDLRMVMNDNTNTQGLSLTLSSVPASKRHVGDQFEERCNSEHLYSRSTNASSYHLPDSKTSNSDYLCPNYKPPIGSKFLANTHQDVVGTSTSTHRRTGPLGPFTGYATILKSSKFLKPSQQLLDEICSVTGLKLMEGCKASNKMSEEARVSADAVNAAASVVGGKGSDSGASSSTFYSSNEINEDTGCGISSNESYWPEYQQKKAKLLYMLEEVCRRYKQYHQQMQMVVSSFESVAGLSGATPYISLALKTVSRHFRCLKNAISGQLRYIRKALGEDLSSLTTGTSSCKGDTSTSRSKFIDHNFQKQKPGGGNLGFFEPQQHVWRPQRGLPERAVAILRAWLFDHFLHPYPTDMDKHMLATQTGLSRNQVSNWFINARVRVWKPMVEEIHMLETNGLAETTSNVSKTNRKPATESGSSRQNDNQPINRHILSAMSDKQAECFVIGSSACIGDGPSEEPWSREKRSRVECQIPTSMDQSLIGFMPYQRSGLETGGMGAVSLTLGLRQSAETAQQQQLQEHQLRQHFGGQMIHDFVG